jgi:VCBS repeat-containing protein
MAANNHRQSRRNTGRHRKAVQRSQSQAIAPVASLHGVSTAAASLSGTAGYARYVGRVGSLALALGVGVAVVTGLGLDPGLGLGLGVAHAEGPPPADADNGPADDDTPPNVAGLSADPATPIDPTPPTERTRPKLSRILVPTLNFGASPRHQAGYTFGGLIRSRNENDGEPNTPAAAADPPAAPQNARGQNLIDTIDEDSNTSTQRRTAPHEFGNRLAHRLTSAAAGSSAPAGFTEPAAASFMVMTATPPQGVPAPAPLVHQPAGLLDVVLGTPAAATNIVSRVAAVLLAPFITPGPHPPVGPPVLLAALSLVGRELERTFFNSRPHAVADTASTSEDIGTTIDVLANDTDRNLGAGDVLTVSDYTQPAHGTVVLNPDGTFNYTPNENFHGTDEFSYTVSDAASPWHTHGLFGVLFGGGHTDKTTVSITVTSVDDAPDAVDDVAGTVSEDSTTGLTYNVLNNDTDPDGDTLTITAVTNTPPTYGTVSYTGSSVTYTPSPTNTTVQGLDVTETLTDTFTYDISDGNGGTDTATVTVTITGANDAPVGVADDAGNVGAHSTTGVTYNVITNDTDVDGETLSVGSITQGQQGTVINNGDGTLTYTPDATNYLVQELDDVEILYDTFTYTVTDGTATSGPVDVTVTITGANDAPVGMADDFGNVGEDSTTGVTYNVLTNDTDVDHETLWVGSITQGQHGTVTDIGDGTLTYIPNANDPLVQGLQTGQTLDDIFTYTVFDGDATTGPVTVTVTITGANDAPTAANDSFSTNEDSTGVTRTLPTGSDVDGETLTYAIVANPTHGTISNFNSVTGAYTFTPNGAQQGLDDGEVQLDSFDYRVNDGTANSNTATVTLSIVGLNDAPTAANDSFTVSEDSAGVTRTLPAGSDVDVETLSYAIVANPTKGTISNFNSSNGSYTYTPAANYDGADSFTYRVNDGNANSNTATVNITVGPDDNADDNEIGATIAVAGTPTDVVFSPNGSKAYTANTNGTVSVINTANNTLIDTNTGTGATDPITLPAGQIPRDLAVSPDNSRLYVVTADSTTGAGQLWVYDTTTYSQIDANPGAGNSIAVANNPVAVAVENNRIYVAGSLDSSAGRVTVINANTSANTYTVVGAIAAGSEPIAMTATSERVYVTYANNTVQGYTILDNPNSIPTADGGWIASDPFGAIAARTTAPSTDNVYVLLHVNDGFIFAYQHTPTGNETPVGSSVFVPLGGQATDTRSIAVNGDRGYVADGGGSVLVFDSNTMVVIDVDPYTAGVNPISLPAGVAPTDVAINPNGDNVYVTGNDGKVYVVNIGPTPIII